LTTEKVVERVVANRRMYEERNAAKQKKELAIYQALQSEQ
jgi:hypothetical protein